MSETSPITGELSNSKVAAVFPFEAVARDAAQGVAATLSLGAAQVQVITPGRSLPGRTRAPASRRVWRALGVAQVWLGVSGAVVGLLAFGTLYASDIPFIADAPVAAALVLLFSGAAAGLMLGGLVSLRPDHDGDVEAMRDAIDTADTTVVVHAFSTRQADQAAAFLRAQGGDVTSMR